jgi:hypothetical protein
MARTVVAEPLDPMRDARRSGAEGRLDALGPEIADVSANEMSGLRHPRDDLAIAAVERERDMNTLAVPADSRGRRWTDAISLRGVMTLPSFARETLPGSAGHAQSSERCATPE